MTAEHTKGPWRATIGEPLYVDEHAYGLGDCQVLDANDELVADINGTKEAPARARLIAAAPELLEACKDGIKFLNSLADTEASWENENRDAFRRILTKAIAEAEEE